MSDQELLNGDFNIDTRYRSGVKNLRLLENEYQYYDRSKEAIKKIIKSHAKTGGTILLVAHAPSLEVLTRHLMGGQPRPERLVELAGKVDYCSMTIVEGEPSSKSWQFRYSLDEPAPSALLSNYMVAAPKSQFELFPQQDAYPSYFVI
jgi:broad specificity phosphatase PhoE